MFLNSIVHGFARTVVGIPQVSDSISNRFRLPCVRGNFSTVLNVDCGTMGNDVAAVIIKCVNFAAVKHSFQRRKDPEETPYINHPIGFKFTFLSLADLHTKNYSWCIS